MFSLTLLNAAPAGLGTPFAYEAEQAGRQCRNCLAQARGKHDADVVRRWDRADSSGSDVGMTNEMFGADGSSLMCTAGASCALNRGSDLNLGTIIRREDVVELTLGWSDSSGPACVWNFIEEQYYVEPDTSIPSSLCPFQICLKRSSAQLSLPLTGVVSTTLLISHLARLSLVLTILASSYYGGYTEAAPLFSLFRDGHSKPPSHLKGAF
ncbi:hypothetical protein AXG93_1420s1110 [Marchantia polymorpha subsp. ruderalis]|uniref:Uncharacterized protein n=1 Tax=Marchantia polymorpha subsp. ruderalis TaxID=1480154 RepID=A0A176VWQ5_MARPO|nr:hypothetical protein AXG93_1420s1110 [Marchantia polymorpha subsp. ruderalis]